MNKIIKSKNYQEYLDALSGESDSPPMSKTYLEIPKHLLSLFKSGTYRTLGHQIGELIFNGLKGKEK